MHHKREVNILETAVFEHDDFSANGLFRRRAIYDDTARQAAGDCFCERNGGAQMERPLQVMPAAVPNALEGIIFAEQADPGPAFAVLPNRAERGREPSNPELDCKAVCAQVLGLKQRWPCILRADFGVVANKIGHGKQVLSHCVNALKTVALSFGFSLMQNAGNEMPGSTSLKGRVSAWHCSLACRQRGANLHPGRRVDGI